MSACASLPGLLAHASLILWIFLCAAGEFVAWASNQRHLALYTCSAERIAGFRARHPEVAAGRGCLRFRDSQRLPLADLAQVVRNALAPGRAILARELASPRR